MTTKKEDEKKAKKDEPKYELNEERVDLGTLAQEQRELDEAIRKSRQA